MKNFGDTEREVAKSSGASGVFNRFCDTERTCCHTRKCTVLVLFTSEVTAQTHSTWYL